MPAVRWRRQRNTAFVASLDHALGVLLNPLAKLLPRRLRRAAEKIEQEPARPIGQIAAVGFLFASVLYGLTASGQIGRLGDSLLVLAGFGIRDVQVIGGKETPELAVVEKLEIKGSLIAFDVGKAQERLATLPWVERAIVRKFYPGSLSVEIAERTPFALWQRDGQVFVVDRGGTEIVPLEDQRFARLPFIVGAGANKEAPALLAELSQQPAVAAQMRAAVLIAGRRWDLHLVEGVTVKLPEKNVRQALVELVQLDTSKQLLSRDVTVVDLRLSDRVTVRLPEGRSLEDVMPGGSGAATPVEARI